MRAVGETLLAIHYEADPDAVERRLPDPLEPNRSGEAFVYVADAIVNDTAARADPASIDPYATSFRQFCVVLPCRYDGTEGTYFTHHRVDTDLQLRTVRSMGYDSALADVHLTRYPPELREFTAPGAGDRVAGVATANGETLADAAVDLTERTDPAAVPWPVLTVFSRRSIADDTAGTGRESLADDLLLEVHEREWIDNVWTGDPTLELGSEALADLQPRTLRGGYYFDIGLVLGGLRPVSCGLP